MSNFPFRIFPPSPNWYLSRSICLSLSLDILAFASKSRVHFLKPSNQSFLLSFQPHSERITALVIKHDSNNGKSIELNQKIIKFMTAAEKSVKIWELNISRGAVPTLLHEVEVEEEIICADFLQFVVVGTKKGLIYWNFEKLKLIRKFSTNSAVTAIAISPQSNKIAFGLQSGAVQVWNPDNEILQNYIGHEDLVQSLYFKPERENFKDEVFFTTSKDRSLRVWRKNVETPCNKFVLKSKSQGQDKNFWMMGCWYLDSILITGMEGEILNLLLENNAITYLPMSHHRAVFNIVQCIDSSSLNFLSYSLDRQLIMWDNCKPLWSLPTLGSMIYNIENAIWSPNKICFAMGDKTVGIWDSEKKFQSITLYWKSVQANVTCVSWHPFTEGVFAFGTDTGRVCLMNGDLLVAAYQCKGTVYQIQIVEDERVNGNLHRVVNISNEKTDNLKKKFQFCKIFVCCDNEIFYYNASLNQNVSIKLQLLAKATAFGFCFDYKFFAVGYADGSVQIFEDFVLVGTFKLQSKRVYKLKFFRNKFLASSAEDSSIIVIDITSMNQDMKSYSLVWHASTVYDISWSSDMKLVSSSLDCTAAVWDLNEISCHDSSSIGLIKSVFKPIFVLQHFSRVLTCLFHSQNIIYTTCDDQSFQIWDLNLCTPAENSFNEFATRNKLRKKKEKVVEIVTSNLSESAEKLKVVESLTDTDKKKNRALAQFASFPGSFDKNIEFRCIYSVLFSLYPEISSISFSIPSDELIIKDDEIVTAPPLCLFQTKSELHKFLSELPDAEKMQKLKLMGLIWSGDYQLALEYAESINLLSGDLVLLSTFLCNPSAFPVNSDNQFTKYLKLYSFKEFIIPNLILGKVEETVKGYLTRGLYSDAAALCLYRYYRKDESLLLHYRNWAEAASSNFPEYAARIYLSAYEPESAINMLNSQHNKMLKASSSFNFEDPALISPVYLRTMFLIARVALSHNDKLVYIEGCRYCLHLYRLLFTSFTLRLNNSKDYFQLHDSLLQDLLCITSFYTDLMCLKHLTEASIVLVSCFVDKSTCFSDAITQIKSTLTKFVLRELVVLFGNDIPFFLELVRMMCNFEEYQSNDINVIFSNLYSSGCWNSLSTIISEASLHPQFSDFTHWKSFIHLFLVYKYNLPVDFSEIVSYWETLINSKDAVTAHLSRRKQILLADLSTPVSVIESEGLRFLKMNFPIPLESAIMINSILKSAVFSTVDVNFCTNVTNWLIANEDKKEIKKYIDYFVV